MPLNSCGFSENGQWNSYFILEHEINFTISSTFFVWFGQNSVQEMSSTICCVLITRHVLHRVVGGAIKFTSILPTFPLKIIIRDFSWCEGGRCLWLTIYHPCSAETSRKSGALTYLEPLEPPRPVAGDLCLLYPRGHNLWSTYKQNFHILSLPVNAHI